jgi:DNA invertase Pin-like site-specific DNA recombinase
VTRQLDDCLALADRLGWEVVARFDDNDLSAYNGKIRPGFEQMLEAMRRGEFGALICWHPDRLYRSMKDLERLIDIADAGGVQLRTVNGGDLDLSNATGRMLARILGSVARQESEHKGERQRRANEQRRAAGKWVRAGRRPFGYSRDGESLEPEAALVRKAAADVLGGRSLRSIATGWNAQGLTTTRGNPWTNLALRRILTNPLYAALVTYQRRVVGRGEWEPLLDEDTHRGLVAFLSDPARQPGSAFETKHMGSGVYRCGKCDGKMYAAYPHGKGTALLYVCKPTAHVGRLGAALDEYVEALVLAWFSQPKTRKRLTALLNGRRGVDMRALQAQRDALQARMDKLARMHIAGDIDDSQLRSGTSEHRAQRDAIDKVLTKASRRSPAAGMLAADDPREYWAGCSPDLRGKIVDEIMTVTVLPDAPRGPWFKDRDEPTTAEWERFGEYLDIKPKVAK